MATIKLLLVLITAIQLKGVILDSLPLIKIQQGLLQGTYLTSANGRKFAAFQGIPYAHPPTGEYRFKAPAPPDPWTGTWNASERGSECLQNMEIQTFANEPDKSIAGDEDCLFINVYTTKLPTGNPEDSLLDVIVYIHGGCFMHGSGTVYGPKYLMDRDVLMVTFNYRLGPLGFLSTEDEVVPGNMGLKDQSAALRWIKDNIAAFGGNPKSITIIGTSAGGASVHFHYLSPLSRGLFHRGYSQSGTALCPWAQMEGGRAKAKKLAAALGCSTETSEAMVECLRQRPAYKIVQQVKYFKAWLHSPFSPFGPVIEKAGSRPFLDKHPNDIILEGKAQNLPWITSVDKDEGIYPTADFIANEDLLQELEERFDEIVPHLLHFNYTVANDKKEQVAKSIRNFYFKDKPISKETVPNIVQMASDRLFTMELQRAARMHAAIYSAPVYFYLFSYRGKHSLSEFMAGTSTNFGVSHGDDTGYTIDCYFYSSDGTQEDKRMRNLLLDVWASYAKTGDPNPKGRKFTWERVQPASKEFNYLHIKNVDDIKMETNDDLGNRKFWDALPIEEEQYNVEDLAHIDHHEL